MILADGKRTQELQMFIENAPVAIGTIMISPTGQVHKLIALKDPRPPVWYRMDLPQSNED